MAARKLSRAAYVHIYIRIFTYVLYCFGWLIDLRFCGARKIRGLYQAALPNGTKVNIPTDPSCPDRLVWQWLSSPVLFLLDPITLNSGAFYTLNHFTEWVPPHLTIAAPLPCSAKVEEFLTLMTTSVSSTMNVQCVFSCTHEDAPC